MPGQKDRSIGFIIELDSGALCVLDLKIGAVRTRVPPSVGPEFWHDASRVAGAGGLVAKHARAAIEIGYIWPNPQALNGIGRQVYRGQCKVLAPTKMAEPCKPNHQQNRGYTHILDSRRVLQMNPANVDVRMQNTIQIMISGTSFQKKNEQKGGDISIFDLLTSVVYSVQPQACSPCHIGGPKLTMFQSASTRWQNNL